MAIVITNFATMVQVQEVNSVCLNEIEFKKHISSFEYMYCMKCRLIRYTLVKNFLCFERDPDLAF